MEFRVHRIIEDRVSEIRPSILKSRFRTAALLDVEASGGGIEKAQGITCTRCGSFHLAMLFSYRVPCGKKYHTAPGVTGELRGAPSHKKSLILKGGE